MLIYQSPMRANSVLDAISASVGPNTTAYRVAVAYVTRDGARRLVDAVRARVGEGWQGLTKIVVTCFDFGHTEPAALEYLQQEGFEVRIANLEADGKILLRSSSSSFHPKLYLACGFERVHAVIGSANLSRRALTVNAEAVSVMELSLQEVEKIWGELEASSVSLSADLLEKYREIRPRQRRTPRQDEAAVPVPVAPADLPIFKDAVENGVVDPKKHQAFWVEAGRMSGGSESQLELPRLAHRFFFDYRFNSYDEQQGPIGELALTATTGTNIGPWQKPLTWHGNNRMERMNLPTTAESGLAYTRQVILFQRAGAAFDVSVSALESERATRWLEESAASETLFRIGDKSPWRCGLI